MDNELTTKKLTESEESISPAPPAPASSLKSSTAWLRVVLGGLVLALLGCCGMVLLGLGVYVYVKSDAIPTPAPIYATPVPVPTARGNGVLFSDDFRRADGTWDVYDDEWSKAWYEDGWFHLLVKSDYYLSWSNPAYDFADFVLEVDAQQVSGPDDNNYGVLFRYQDDANFYEFDVSGDGYYTLGKYVDDEWADIIGWIASDHVNQGESFNHLEVVCRGERIELYVNGHHLNTVIDDTFASGDIGLIAGSGAEPNVHVAFDNLEVWELPAD